MHDLSQNHLETSGNTVGAYLVIRGWDETCAGGHIFETQWRYIITGHVADVPKWTSVGNLLTAISSSWSVNHHSDGYGTFGPSSTYHHIIVGADPADPGPTGPTGPTGPQGIQGFTGAPAIGAVGVWDYYETLDPPTEPVHATNVSVSEATWMGVSGTYFGATERPVADRERRHHGTARRCECNICTF